MKTVVLIIVALFFTHTYSSAQWTTVCGSGNGMVVNLTPFHDTIYATGFFTDICGTTAKYIAGWDGSAWHTMDTGLSDAGHNVRVLDDELYVAQYQQKIDSNWVLKWDGSHFNKIGTGVYLTTAAIGTSRTANIYDVTKYGGTLYASGEFDLVDSRAISGIMQWSGTQWIAVGSGLSGSLDGSGIMYPHQLLVHGGSLYVVGNFTTAGGTTVNGVARWDGSSWHAMGAGFNKQAYAIAVINGDIYAGGEFTMSGSTPLQCVAKWNGTDWVDPGFGVKYSSPSLHSYVHTIAQVGTRGVFEGGFDKVTVGARTYSARSVVAFSGGVPDTLSGGISNGEFEGLMAYDDTTILIGGAIFSPGSTFTRIAKHVFTPLDPLGFSGLTSVSQTTIYPNPFTDKIAISGAETGTTVQLQNIVGQVVYNTVISSLSLSVDASSIPAGVYILQCTSPRGGKTYQQLIKQ